MHPPYNVIKCTVSEVFMALCNTGHTNVVILAMLL